MSGKDRPPADLVEQARLQKALRESVILRELADILNSSFDLEHILQKLVQHTTELCEVTRCAVWLLEETWNRYRPVTYYVSLPSLREEMLKAADAIWYRSPLPPDNPVIQRLLAAGGMLYLEDLRTEPTVATFAETFQVHSVLLVALIREGRPVGMLSLDEPGQLYTFSQEQQQLARAIGQQATIAIDNARLYQQAQEQKRRAEQLIERARAIYQVAMTVNSGEELPAVLHLATSHLVQGLGAADGRAMLLEPGETTLHLVGPPGRGTDTDSFAFSLSLDRLPNFRYAITTGKPILISTDQAKEEEIDWFRQFNLKNILVVPLLGSTPHQEANWDISSDPGEFSLEDREEGIVPEVYCPGLIAIHYTRHRKPTRGEYAFAQDIAAQCALAIEKARLLADTRRAADLANERANTLDALSQVMRQALDTFLHIAEAVSHSTDIREILHSVLAETLTTLHCPRGTVHLFQQAQSTFELLLSIGFSPEEEAAWLHRHQIWLDPHTGSAYGFAAQILRGHAVLVNAENCPVQPNPFEDTMVLAAPIKHNQHILGLILLDRSLSTIPFPLGSALASFTSWEITIVEGIAQLAGVAMEQARWQQEAIKARASEAAMREADVMKDEFLAITAHEFRNPLTVILARSQGALRSLRRANHSDNAEMLSATASQIEEHLELIAAQSKQLNNIVTTFLDAARINQGQFTLKTETVDLGQVARQVVENQTSLVEHHTLRCLLDETQAPYLVDGDQARLAQIIANLVENAIKYSPLGGPVTVTLSKRRRSDLPEVIEVCVADKGIGIPPEAQARLFERFYRVSSAASSETRGIGLGLYIVAHLVRLHGGEIRVESSGLLGEGSCFIFTLPALAIPAEHEQPGAGAAR